MTSAMRKECQTHARVHLVVLTNRAKSPKSLTSSAKINMIDFLTVLRFSFLVPEVVSRFASEHKEFLARSLRFIRNILSLTWEQVFDLLHSSLLITVGNKGNKDKIREIREILYDSVLNQTEKIWKIVAALKLVGCGPSITSWSVSSIS